MITPADLAHMLGQTPNAAGNHTQDKLLYTSQTPQNSADSDAPAVSGATDSQAESPASVSAPSSNKSALPQPDAPAEREPVSLREPYIPTPATVFGMKATVTIATSSETIAGQTDGIAAEAGTETMEQIAMVEAAAPAPARRAPIMPNPATVFGNASARSTAPTGTTAPADAAAPAEPAASSEAAEIGTSTAAAATEPAQAAEPASQAQATTPANTAAKSSPVMSAAAAMRAIAAATMHIAPAPKTQSAPAATAPTAMRRAAATGPTPAMMPQRRTSDGPTTFASLDAQELPVVREYSAGGLIFDDQNRVAIIARHSRSGHLEWCLPKGHIEKGETPQQTAVREVHEETGILGEVIDSIATIDYWFTGTTQRVHKLVHHFALRQTGGELTVEGDPDHEAEDAIWVRFDDLDDVLSYPNERKIAWLYARKKNRQANE
ncbi:NUDIX hydrolase [Bifidobacterium sp. LC6]|uniref:NUDIX hydrolase n=1 Tax=Bifidobacterium colobi TaxID=2809026 RepID=A0ABS5UTP8_9BIFI|nr:NUDIX hydrolase [Bifidobacterium colobi]MBT1174374.1 NUDIX hydrolase [Bifidobacterium colobi]